MPKQTALDTINRLIAEENSSGTTRQRTGDAVRTIDQLLAEEEEREQQRRQQTAYQKALNDYTSFAPMDIAKASQEALDSAKSRDNDWWQARRNETSADATKQIAKTSQEILNEKKEPEPVNLTLPAPSVNRALNPALEAEYQRHANAQGTNVAPGAWAQNQMKQANDRQAQAQRNISRAPSGWKDVGLTVGGTVANFLSGSGSLVADIARLMEIPDDILYSITKNERFNLDRAPGLRDSEALRASDQFAEAAQNASDQVGKFGQQLISTGRAAGNMMAYSALLGNAFGQVANPGRMASLSNAASDGITQIASKSSLITSAAGRAGAKIALDVLTNPGNVGISLGSAINSYSDAYANGATIGQALANGVGKGLAEYFSNKMFSGTPFEDAKDAQGYVSRLVEHIAKDTKWEELLKAFNSSTGGKAVNWVIDKIGEGLEEVITGLADPVVDKLTYKWDTDMATFDELTDEFFGGVLLSLLMSGGEALMNQVVTGGKADERRIADAFVSMGVKRNVANKFAKKVAEATTAVTETEGWLNGSYNGKAAELMRNQDYAEKSAGNAEVAAQAQDSDSESLQRYSNIFNRMDEASKVLSGTSPSEVSETAWVNELEARNYFYIWETQGAKAADAYYEQTVLPGVLNKKARAQEQFDQIQRQEAEKAAQQEAARTALQDIATAEETQPARDRRSELEAQIESVGQQAANIYEEDGRYYDRNTGEEMAQDTLRDLSNQYRQLRQEYDNLETEVNNGQVEQQRTEAPVRAAESGTTLLGGGQGRVALRSLGESAQKQAGQGGFVRQGQRAYDRRNRKGSARKVKASELGLTGAKEGAETLVFNRDQWDDDMRETADLVKRATGLDAVFVLGNIDLDDGGSIRGAFTGNSVIVQCDHPEYTVAQLAAHESYHALAASNPGLDEQVKAYIRSVAGGEAKLREITGRYIEKLGDVFGLSDDMTEAEYQAAKAAIEQELLADAFAGMNVWGAGATQISTDVRSAVNANRQNAAATERTTGPPVPGRLTLPTNEGRTESEPKTGVESVEKYSLNTQTIDYAIKYVTRDEELKGQLSLIKNDIVELADIQNVITKALGKKASRNIHDLNDYLNENRKVWKRLWDIQQELIDNGIQCDFVTKPGTKNEIDGKKVPGGLKGLPIEYVASDTGKRFKFTAFWRNIPQMLLDAMTHDSRERIRTAIMHGVEDAYARKTGETDLLPYFKDQFPKKGEMNKVIGEKKLKNIRNQTQKRVQPPIRDAEKTVGALNLNSACPMFTIGNNGCYLDACYLTQMANGATGTNLFRSAWYTGELLQIAQSDIELMNELGGLRVNGVGDTTLDNKSQIKDALRHAGMRGLKVKIITKQRATLEVLKEMHDAGEDVSHITVQPSMDNLWIPAKLDDAYGAGVRGSTQLAQTVKAGRNEAAAVAYDEMFGRATKVMDGVLYRKYGFTAEQIREMQEDFPFVNITPRYVVCTAAEIAEIALNRDGQYVNGGKTIQTLMHGKVPSGCVSDYPGELINFGGARHVVERKDGKWHFFGEYISKGKDGKGKVGKIIDGPKTPYGKVQSYIENNYTKAEQDKIWLTLKNQMCCQANDFKDACAGCQSLCARGCGAFSAEDFDYRKYSQKEKARAMETGAGEMDAGSGLTLPTAEKYSRDVTNETPERRYNIPDGYAAFVRNTAARFADRIVNGEKTIETRKDRTLDAYLGKWMPIIKTESGEVIGEAFIDSVKEYDNPDDFYADSDKHFVTRGDKQFGWDGTGKRYGYNITAVRKYDTPIPKGDKRYGRIAAEFNNAAAEQSAKANKARKAGATLAQVAANEKYSREINALTYFSGGGLVDYAMRDVIGSGMAVEFDKGAAAVYALNNGKVYVGDVRNFSKTELAKMDGVEYFHASPVCKNYSRMNIRRSQLSDGNTDITTAQATADAIRGLDSLKVFTLEQVPEYDGSDALKIITDALDEMGFVWDKTVANAHDYGGATSRERLMLRAVKDGKLPPLPAKVKGYSWFEATADLITGLEAKDRLSPFMQERINRTPELVAALKNQTEPILLLGGTPGGKAWWSPASDPCPSITTDMQDARILMPDGTIRKPNPRFFARIMGLPDSYKFSQWRNRDNATQGYKVIGNGVPVQLTQKFFGNLLDDALDTGVKYSLEEDMNSELEDKLVQFAKAVDAPQSFSSPDMLASMYRMYRNGLDNERILGPNADIRKARALAEEIDALTGKAAERRESVRNESVGDWALRMYAEQYAKPGEDLLEGIQKWVTEEVDYQNERWKAEWEPAALRHFNEAYERTDFSDINSIKEFFEDAEAASKENGEPGFAVYGYYDEEHGNSVRFSREERPEVVERLDQQMKDGNYVIVYHSMYQDKNGKLYSPMAGKKKVGNEWVMTDPYALNTWYKSDVPENIADLIENGTVKLKDSGGWSFLLKKPETGGTDVPAALNPWNHASTDALNDQFNAAFARETDEGELVTVECVIPLSEVDPSVAVDPETGKVETKPYEELGMVTDRDVVAKPDSQNKKLKVPTNIPAGTTIKPKDSVGLKMWKAGPVHGQISGKRPVYLSRWIRNTRVLSTEETAKMIAKTLKDENFSGTIPGNVVGLKLRKALENEGVKFGRPTNKGYYAYMSERGYTKQQAEGEKLPAQQKYSREEDEAYLAAVNSGDMEKAQRMVDEAAKKAGYRVEKYHGTKANFNTFDPDYARYGGSGYGYYFGDKEIAEEFGADDYGEDGNVLRVLINDKNIGTIKTHNITADGFESALESLGLSPEKTYKYHGADSAAEYVKAHHDYRLATDLQYWASIPRKYAENSSAKEMPPRKILAILQDNLGLDGIRKDSFGRELVLWDNHLMKLADPVTYDDDGNIIPLSQRFNPKSNDIRYSTEEEEYAPQSAAEYDQLKKAGKIKAAKEKVKKPVAKSKATIAKKDLRNALITSFSIPDGYKADIGKMIDGIADRIIRDGRVSYQDQEELFSKLYSTGEMTVPADDMYQAAREIIRGGKVYVPEKIKHEFSDDWNDFRRQAFAEGIYLTNNPEDKSADSWNAELSSEFPGLFPEDNYDQKDILERIVSAAKAGRDEKMSLAEYAAKAVGQEYISEDELLDNMERQLDWALRTFADKAGLEIYLKDRTGVKLAEEREKFGRELDRRTAAEIARRAKKRDKLKEAAQKAREQKAMRELQQKTLKQLQWLNKNRYKFSGDMKAEVDKLLEDIDTYAISAANELHLDKKRNMTWRDIRDLYLEAKESDPNFLPSKELERIVARLDYKKIGDMDVGALTDLYKAAVGLRTELYNRNNLIADELHQTFQEVYDAAKDEINEAPGSYNTGGKGFWDKYWNDAQLTPMNRLQRMAGWNPDSRWYGMAKMLEQGERAQRRFKTESARQLAPVLEQYKDWIKTADGQGKDAVWYKYEVPESWEYRMGDKPVFSDKTVTVWMTPAQKVHMYLESKNYDNLRHMEGGRTFANKELYSKGERTEAFAQGTTVRLLPETVKAMVSDLTPEEQALADALEKYYNGFSKDEINRVSNLLYGYDKAMEASYAPIYTNNNYTKSEPGNFDVTAEGVGNLKSRVVSSNPSLNIGAFDAFEKSVDKTSKFVGLAIPVQNMNTLMNWREKGNSMKDIIDHKWGEKETKWIEDLLTELQSGNDYKRGSVEKLTNAVLSKYISAVFGANPSIVAKQFASYPLAATYLGWENMPKFVPTAAQVDTDLMAKYTGELDYRLLGYATPETATLKDNPSKLQQKGPLNFLLGGGAITWMDGFTVRTLWTWAENKVKREQPDLERGTQGQIDAGESEYYKAVAKEFEEAVSRSQPMYDVMHRSNIMRESNPVTRALTLFKTVPQQELNMLRQAIGEAEYYKRAKADADTLSESRTKVGRAALGVITGNLMIGLITFLNALWKNRAKRYRDEDGELNAESIIGAALKQYVKDSAGLVVGGGEAADLLSAILLGDKWYGLEMPGIEQIGSILEQTVDAGTMAKDIVQGSIDVLSNGGDWGQYMADNSEKYLAAVDKAVSSIGTYATGLPMDNLKAYLLGTVTSIFPQIQTAYEDATKQAVKGGLKGLTGASLEVRAKHILQDRAGKVERDTIEALTALYEAGYDKVIPSAQQTKITVKGEERELNVAQQQIYKNIWKETVGGALNELVNSKAFLDADDKTQAKMIEKLYDVAAEKAKGVLFDDYESTTENKLDAMQNAGASVADYAATTGATADAKRADSYETILASDMSDEAKLAAIGNIIGTDMTTDAGNPTQWARLNTAVKDGMSVDDAMDLMQNELLDDYDRWRSSDAKKAGIGWNIYKSYKTDTGAMKADKDANGKSISGTKKAKVLDYINRMNITKSQKDALYYDAGYTESGLKDAPWHQGGGSGSGNYARLTLPTAKKPWEVADDMELRSMNDYGGNVDLTNRKSIPITQANIGTVRGWNNMDDARIGDRMTVASQTYNDGDTAIVVTPILPDGTLMTQRELDNYMDSIIRSGDYANADKRGIILGVFDDGDWNENLTASDKFANRLHELHERKTERRSGLRLPEAPKVTKPSSGLRLPATNAAPRQSSGLKLK